MVRVVHLALYKSLHCTARHGSVRASPLHAYVRYKSTNKVPSRQSYIETVIERAARCLTVTQRASRASYRALSGRIPRDMSTHDLTGAFDLVPGTVTAHMCDTISAAGRIVTSCMPRAQFWANISLLHLCACVPITAPVVHRTVRSEIWTA